MAPATTPKAPPGACSWHCSTLLLLLAAWVYLTSLVTGQQDVASPLPVSTSCALTRGDWCQQFYAQPELPSVPPKRGSTECPNACSNLGNCDYDTGTCYCPAGYGGKDCSQPRKRPCWRMGPDKKDTGWKLNHDWSHSRCAGICDDNDSMCYCPEGTKYGHIPAPPGSPWGAPPLQAGRPMYWCQPSSDENNSSIKWGAVPYEHLLGPNGWCNGEIPSFHCPCRLDGLLGERCQIQGEAFCHNQCSGHGQCKQGFCKCHPGWYGNDCSRKKKGLSMEPGDQEGGQPWLRAAITRVQAAEDPPSSPSRKRPFIYVYDTWPEYNTDIMQYRIDRSNCVYRRWALGNVSEWADRYTYAIESVLIELFMTSGHRTYDPSEADFFFVPTMAGCLYDVYGWNPIPMWPARLHGSRPFGSSNMLLWTKRWLSQQFPWFNRTGGQDHIWLMPHDEGACAAPQEIWPGVILSHWGRMDFPHTSNSQYHADNYTVEIEHSELPGGAFQWSSVRTHPCFDPDKDLVIPSFKGPFHYSQSQYMGHHTPGEGGHVRDIFIFFRGDVGRHRDDKRCIYSRCIRQTLAKAASEGQWQQKYSIVYGEGQGGDYSTQLSRARFCLVLPGDGWSARYEDAMLHGCIPVIIMDHTQAPFESLLDVDSFSLRIRQQDIPSLPDIVLAVSQEREEQMRRNVNKVWQRFRWSGLQMIDREISNILRSTADRNGGSLPQGEGTEYAGTTQDNAFDTIMQWLLSRVPFTRGAPRDTEKMCSKENTIQCERVVELCKAAGNLTYASVPQAVGAPPTESNGSAADAADLIISEYNSSGSSKGGDSV